MKLFSKPLLILIFLFISQLGYSQTNLLTETASVSFTIKNMGMSVVGNFKEIKSKIIFDENQLDLSSISAYIPVSSINTGIDSRDKHLKGKDYFHTEKYPNIEIKSTKLVKESATSFTGYFDLKIKDVLKSIEIPIEYEKVGSKINFSATFTINRLDFTVGSSSWILSEDVIIKVDISTKK